MAVNPTLFPPDFPSELLGNSSDTFSLENAVTTLQVQARDTAVKEALSRKIAGQNAITNQNRAVSAINAPMPLNYVGAVVQPTPFLGTAGYLGGGRGHGSTFVSLYRVLFSNEIFVKLGIRLTAGRVYCGTVGDARSGYFCGGAGAHILTTDQLFYLREVIARTGMTLSTIRFGQAGGKGDKVKGFLTGGTNTNGNVVRGGDKLTYASNTMTGLGNFISGPRFSPHNGIGSKTFGYDCGGLSQFLWVSPPLFSVERISYAAETSASISTVLPHAHVVHAAASYDVKGYMAGGNTNQPANWYWFSNDITAFTFSGETAVIISAKLPEGKLCLDGTGSSVAAYFCGGDTISSDFKGTRSADKLTYSNESCVRMGSQLSDTLADQGAISNYGSGFSH